MPGINRYETQVRLANATSLNESATQTLLKMAASALRPSTPCIFLSHKSEDKEAVRKIGAYITQRGVDIYLDIEDPNLQKAVKENDHKRITQFIEIGIRASTDLMTVISEKTKSSWWVPYEIGYGKSSGASVATMKLRDVTYLPSFLVITRILQGTKSLDAYIDEVKQRELGDGRMFDKTADLLLERLATTRTAGHPLSAYLAEGV